MTTKQQYRDALDALELAVQGLGIDELVVGWGDPPYRDEIGVKIPTTAGDVYQIHRALTVASQIMNEGGGL